MRELRQRQTPQITSKPRPQQGTPMPGTSCSCLLSARDGKPPNSDDVFVLTLGPSLPQPALGLSTAASPARRPRSEKPIPLFPQEPMLRLQARAAAGLV